MYFKLIVNTAVLRRLKWEKNFGSHPLHFWLGNTFCSSWRLSAKAYLVVLSQSEANTPKAKHTFDKLGENFFHLHMAPFAIEKIPQKQQ